MRTDREPLYDAVVLRLPDVFLPRIASAVTSSARWAFPLVRAANATNRQSRTVNWANRLARAPDRKVVSLAAVVTTKSATSLIVLDPAREVVELGEAVAGTGEHFDGVPARPRVGDPERDVARPQQCG